MVGPRLASRRALQIAAALVIGLASHVVLDAIPHADYPSLSRRAITLFVLAEAIAIAAIAVCVLRRRIRPRWRWPMFAGVAGATIPDVKFLTKIVLPARFADDVARVGNEFHRWFHADDTSLTIGMTTQVVSAVLLLAALFAFRRADPSLRSG